MVDGRRLDDMSADIDEAAARWHLAQADDDMDWSAFTEWLEADPRHRDAYDAMALLDDRIDAAGSALHPRPADQTLGRRMPRWGAWSAIAAVVIAAVVLLLYQGRRGGEPAVIAYRTGPGQVRTIHLADGSRAILAPGSLLRVPASREQALTLDGSAFFDVRHDAGRPLTVRAGRYTIRDVGTRFDIAMGEGVVRVAVAEGEVAVSSPDRGDATAVVAGRALTIQGQDRGVLRSIDMGTVGGWRSGPLVYDDVPLGLVVADIARASGTAVTVDGAVAERRFSGVIAQGDGRRMAQSLAALTGLALRVDGDAIHLADRTTR
ncbi:FecR domain-containing protein [Sphingomonas sp. S6]|jgi:transmembrane sensor|uniref:FecR family protein n=1 Tax=Sphingomonas sp. S6 TaxID=3368600 RepID=UPI000FAF87C9|nr:FecR domain-containing protein [uncultured Sphingomonas sp.]RTL20459.1 MAG: hypothetical protein EKK50_04900 [Sphingomonadaceae bacterium]